MRLVIDIAGNDVKRAELVNGLVAEPIEISVRKLGYQPRVTVPPTVSPGDLNDATEAGAAAITNCQGETTDRERHTAQLVVLAAAPILKGAAHAAATSEQIQRELWEANAATLARVLLHVRRQYLNSEPEGEAEPGGVEFAIDAALMAHDVTGLKAGSA